MDIRKQEETVYGAEGFGTLSAGAVVGDQTGPAASLSNNRGPSEVYCQASVESIITDSQMLSNESHEYYESHWDNKSDKENESHEDDETDKKNESDGNDDPTAIAITEENTPKSITCGRRTPDAVLALPEERGQMTASSSKKSSIVSDTGGSFSDLEDWLWLDENVPGISDAPLQSQRQISVESASKPTAKLVAEIEDFVQTPRAEASQDSMMQHMESIVDQMIGTIKKNVSAETPLSSKKSMRLKRMEQTNKNGNTCGQITQVTGTVSFTYNIGGSQAVEIASPEPGSRMTQNFLQDGIPRQKKKKKKKKKKSRKRNKKKKTNAVFEQQQQQICKLDLIVAGGNRSAAVSIAVDGSGITLAKALRIARQKVNIEDLDIQEIRAKRACTGGITYEVFGPDCFAKSEALTERIKDALRGTGVQVTRPMKVAQMCLYDLDDSVTLSEVVTAVATEGRCPEKHVKTGNIRTSSDGLGMIWVQCPRQAAKRVVATGRLRIGWISAKVKFQDDFAQRCYRCLQLGHAAQQCSNKARCYQCGRDEHLGFQCTEPPMCPFCMDAGRPHKHRLGDKCCIH